VQRLLTPSRKQEPAALFYPLVLKPDKKITIRQLISVLRDRYQGTPYDASSEPSCISHTNSFKERIIGISNTVHTGVIQLRGWLPAGIGAVMWAGLASAPTTVYIPYYLGIKEVPEPYGIAGPKFAGNSAFWIFRNLSILVDPYFPRLIDTVLPVWQEMEDTFFAIQGSVENAALELYKKDEEAAGDFLTFYTGGLALKALAKAKQLAAELKTGIAKGI
jgi:dipeptidase